MRVVIVGAGMVGLQVAQYLTRERHDVALVEASAEVARHASNRLDCLVLNEQGGSARALDEAGLARADTLIAVTGSDELNLIICGLSAARYPAVRNIARVRSQDYARLGEATGGGRSLGVDCFVQPDVEASRAILDAVEHGAWGEVISFANTTYELGAVDVARGSAFDGLEIKNYRNLDTGESLLTLVERGGETILPNGATTLAAGDRVYVLAREAEIEKVFTLAGRREKPLRRVGVAGGGRVGRLVASGLLSGRFPAADAASAEPQMRPWATLLARLSGFFHAPKPARDIVIIEQDYDLCKELSGLFPDALVLNEDISDENFIAEERISSLDLIVAATQNQELNVITALYLKSKGVRRAAATVSGAGYAVIARQLGVDVVVPVTQVVADAILSQLFGAEIKRIHRLGDGKVGLLEIEVTRSSPLAGKPIMAFHVAAGSLVLLVSREGRSFIPRGDYVFAAGDRLVVITKNGGEAEMERFFG